MKGTTLSVITTSARRARRGIGRVDRRSGRGPSRRVVRPHRLHGASAEPVLPLVPGTVSTYRGTEDGERFRERVVVTDRTRTIQGVTTTVVSDVVRRADGSLVEKTRDWYATDHDGNVWYFGEATATYGEHGGVESREGSGRPGSTERSRA